MNILATSEFWSIVASFVSIILAFFAIALSIYFFVKGRKTETEVSNSLVEIKTQAGMLQKITSRQMDRLTKYVTEQRPITGDETLPHILTILAQLPNQLTSTLSQTLKSEDKDRLLREIHISWAVLYFYTAQANFWSQFYLPSIDEFDSDDEWHNLIKRIVDMSAADFSILTSFLEGQNLEHIKDAPAYNLFHETILEWKHTVRNTEQVFIYREQAAKKA